MFSTIIPASRKGFSSVKAFSVSRQVISIVNRRVMSAASDNGEMVIKHDQQNKVFYIDLDEGSRGVVEYQMDGKKVMDTYHTGVPDSHQGKGIAGKLVEAVLSYVEENNLVVRPSCSYVKHYISKHKDDQFTSRHVEQ